ncbi:MAG: glycosyltransferase [Phycisphaerae bacterium]|nr:glycosyltransferase [Phycisphaerae bacterium]
MPNVSVCIPTYNRERLLKDTLDSVFAQTYRDFEVVIVDDGSTDGTKQMLEKHGFNVRYYRQKNSGDAAARNKLIELAQGRYISFLDSDDLLFPDALEEMVRAMPKDADDVIVYGPYVAIDEKGDIVHRRKKRLFSGRITTNLFENILIHSCGSLFPKKVLVEQNGFDISLSVCSDYDLWLRLSLKYGFIGIDKPVFKRRRHSGNISKICFANRDIEYKVLEKFYYGGGGKNVISPRLAMKRLSKEQYRAARSALRESFGQTALNYFRESLKKSFDLKTLLWMFIANVKLYIALWIQPATDSKTKIAPGKIKSVADIKVAIDLDPVLVNKYSGFYTFGTGLLDGLFQLEEKPELILFHSSKYAKRTKQLVDFELSKLADLKTFTVKMRWLESFWNRFNCPRLESITGDFDVYHCFHHLMPPTKNKPRLMTIHDLRRYKLPQFYGKSKLAFFENAVRRADHFLAISQATKEDLCSVFSIDERRVDVAPLASGIEPVFYSAQQKEEIKSKLSEKLGRKIENYFVAISSPDSRKNIARTVEAFDIAAKDMAENTKLLIIGNLDKRDFELERKLRANLYNNVIWVGTVEDLRPFFACSEALIFASLYEGFGIPILEAFSCGTAVITSNCSSMPEVGGDAAMYIDPFDADSITQAIVKISNNGQLRDTLVSAGRERNKLFTWKKTAQQVVEVYKKLAGF